MRALSLLLMPLVATCSAAPQAATKAPGRYIETLSSGGKTRKYILRVPKGYDGSRTLPVVMVLHGWTGSADAAELYTRMGDKADKEGFVAVFPDGLGNPGFQGWNVGWINLTGVNPAPDDVSFLTSVLDQVEKEVNADKSREFVVGHSNGAFMANLLGAKLGSRLAAIASMAGTIGLSPDKEIPAPTAPVSVLLLHGKADKMVGYDISATALLRPIGAVDSAKFWAKADGCDLTPTTTKSPDGKVVTDRYSGGKNSTEVELVSVEGAPHDWWGGLMRNSEGAPVGVPTYGAPVADLVWEFFRTHPKK
jgi:polyhydroxybutyrate depolymerase